MTAATAIATMTDEDREAARQRAESLERLRRRLIGVGFPERHVRAPAGQLYGEGWLTKGRELARRLGDGFLIALLGESGTGKTQLATSLAYRVGDGGIRYAKALTFFLELHAARNHDYRREGAASELEVIRNYSKPAYLVIDEASERGETEWEDRMLAYLVDERYGRGLDTLLIANQKQEAFLQSIGPRIGSRLQETGGIILCDWPSYRDQPGAGTGG